MGRYSVQSGGAGLKCVPLRQEPDPKTKTSCWHLKILEKLVKSYVDDSIR
jgi:hypothetical protein